MLVLRPLLIFAFVWTDRLFAQVPYLIPSSGSLEGHKIDCNFLSGNFHFHCLPLYLAYLIETVFGLLGTICLLMIIWAGFEWAFTGFQGDTSKAKNRLRNAIFGLIFAVLSYLIVNTVISTLLGSQTP